VVSVEISDHFVSNWGDSSERTLGVAVKGGGLAHKAFIEALLSCDTHLECLHK